jgi:hypothetical protein
MIKVPSNWKMLSFSKFYVSTRWYIMIIKSGKQKTHLTDLIYIFRQTRLSSGVTWNSRVSCNSRWWHSLPKYIYIYWDSQLVFLWLIRNLGKQNFITICYIIFENFRVVTRSSFTKVSPMKLGGSLGNVSQKLKITRSISDC